MEREWNGIHVRLFSLSIFKSTGAHRALTAEIKQSHRQWGTVRVHRGVCVFVLSLSLPVVFVCLVPWSVNPVLFSAPNPFHRAKSGGGGNSGTVAVTVPTRLNSKRRGGSDTPTVETIEDHHCSSPLASVLLPPIRPAHSPHNHPRVMTATLTGMRMTPAVRRITIAIIAIAALCATTAHAANSQPSSPNDVDATPVFRHASLKCE